MQIKGLFLAFNHQLFCRDRKKTGNDLVTVLCPLLKYLQGNVVQGKVTKVVRSDVAGMKIFEIGEKYYFEDLG